MFKKLIIASAVFSTLVFSFGLTRAQAMEASSGSLDVSTSKLPSNFPKPPVINGKEVNFDKILKDSSTSTDAQKITTTRSSIGVSNVILDKDQYQAGDTVSGKLTLENLSNTDQNDVYLDIALAGDYSTEVGKYGLPQIIYDTKSAGPFKAIARSKTQVSFSYVMPKTVGGKGLGLDINARSVSGLPYGWAEAMLKEVTGGKSLLSINDTFTNIDGKKHLPQSGPIIEGTSTINFHLVVKNPSKNSITVTPNINVHDRIYSGKLIKNYKEKTVTILPGKTYEFIFDPYKNENTPGVYAFDVDLVDESGENLAPNMEYRYILPGDIATIQEVKFNQGSVKVGDILNLNVLYSPAPHDMLTSQRKKIDGAILKVQIQDAKDGTVIGEATSSPDMTVELGNAPMVIDIKGQAYSIKAVASITLDGKTLSTYTTSPSTPDTQTENTTNSTDNSFFIVILGIIIALVLILLLFFIRKKPQKNVLMSILVLASLVAGGTVLQKVADAVVVSSSNFTVWYRSDPNCNGCTYPNYYQTASWSSLVVNSPAQNSTITSGNTIEVSGYVNTTGCDNTPENLTVSTFIKNKATKQVVTTQSQLVYNYAAGPTHAGVQHYSRFSFYIPQNLPQGDYLVEVESFDFWGVNGYWDHIGQTYDETLITIVPPITTTCSVSPTVVDKNQPVTWIVNPVGGVPPYTYFWKDSQDTTGRSGPNSITRAYPVSGTVNMVVKVYDSSNTSGVSSQAPVTVNCPQTVTVRDTQTGGTGDQGGTTDVAPQLTRVDISTTTKRIVLTYDQPLRETTPTTPSPTTGAYELKGDGILLTIQSVTIAGNLVTLATNFDSSVNSASLSNSVMLATNSVGSTLNLVSLKYTPPGTNPVQNRNGTPAAAFTYSHSFDTNSNNIVNPPIIVSFGMKPNTVNKNDPCKMYLKVENASTCTLTGSNGYSSNIPIGVGTDAAGTASTTLTSNPIQETTRFTLSCDGITSPGDIPLTTTKTAQCFLNPASTERY